jgi:transposase
MLRMDQVHVIRHKVLVEGVSRRVVAGQMGVSRNTIRKYLAESEPVFHGKVKRNRPVFEKVRPRLDELLEEWSQRTTQKQRITGTRLHGQLVEEGFKVGITIVRDYFREWRRRKLEVYVPLVHRMGDEAQVDFFEVTVEVEGQRRKCWMFLMRLMYSGRDFAWLYEHCDQVSFLDGHVRAFAHFGGVPARCIYDNLGAAVRRVMFPGRKLTGRFQALVSHYLFEPCFARVGTGHDKGGVEGRGKGIRLQHLVPIPRGESFEQLATRLLGSIDKQAQGKTDAQGRTVMERFAEEQRVLRSLPPSAFEPRLVVLLPVSRKALVQYDGATYSVPAHWRLLETTAHVGPMDIRFVWHDEVVQRPRVRRRQKQIRYTDYLVELSRKPQAVRQVAPELLSELSEPFRDLWRMLEQTHGGHEAGRIFARVLGAVVQHGEAAVSAALRRSLEAGQSHLLELASLRRDGLPKEVEVPEPLRQYVVEAAKATDFDHLLEEVVP